MKQIKFPKFKNYTNQKVNFIQPKLDGHLTKIYKHAKSFPLRDDAIIALTKNDKDITEKLLAIDHIKEELDNLPYDSMIFAELHCPGVPATSVPTMLNEANEKLMLTAFAAPLFNGKDCSEEQLKNVMLYLKVHGFNVSEVIEVESCHKQISPHWQKELLEEARETKLEGWVLKEGHMKGWYKLKPVQTLDAVVVETFVSTSETYWGCLKAVRVIVYKPDGSEFNLGNIGVGSKAEKLRYDTDEKRLTLIGRVCEIAYDSVAAKGKLRFPRMVTDDDKNIIWRTDKDSRQCTTEQLK